MPRSHFRRNIRYFGTLLQTGRALEYCASEPAEEQATQASLYSPSVPEKTSKIRLRSRARTKELSLRMEGGNCFCFLLSLNFCHTHFRPISGMCNCCGRGGSGRWEGQDYTPCVWVFALLTSAEIFLICLPGTTIPIDNVDDFEWPARPSISAAVCPVHRLIFIFLRLLLILAAKKDPPERRGGDTCLCSTIPYQNPSKRMHLIV